MQPFLYPSHRLPEPVFVFYKSGNFAAVELDGTCTGEHGIGIGKREFMELEHGAGCDLMKSIKDLVDPKGLMNPGKMFM